MSARTAAKARPDRVVKRIDGRGLAAPARKGTSDPVVQCLPLATPLDYAVAAGREPQDSFRFLDKQPNLGALYAFRSMALKAGSPLLGATAFAAGTHEKLHATFGGWNVQTS